MSKRAWLTLALIVVVVLAVWGISRQDTTDQQTSQTSGKKVVVVVNNGPKETDPVAVDHFKKSIAEFNKVYPDIEIKWTDRPYSPDSFATSMAGGTAEDVITLFATEGYVAERGYALDLTEMINEWDKDQLNMALLEPFEHNGRYYGLPISGYIIGLWYNKQIFRDAGLVDGEESYIVPENWEEFAQLAQKLTDRKRTFPATASMEKTLMQAGDLKLGLASRWGFYKEC